jgi:hypothetical protein
LSVTASYDSLIIYGKPIYKNVLMNRWETSKNRLSEAVMRVSDDNGETFGPMMRLSANGTIGEAAEEKEEPEEEE